MHTARGIYALSRPQTGASTENCYFHKASTSPRFSSSVTGVTSRCFKGLLHGLLPLSRLLLPGQALLVGGLAFTYAKLLCSLGLAYSYGRPGCQLGRSFRAVR